MPDVMYNHASPADPPPHVIQQLAVVFPEWVQAFSPGSNGRMNQGPTGVAIAEYDRDARDVTDLAHRVVSQGYQDALECDMAGDGMMAYAGETVDTAVRLAAMYDLYMDLRAQGYQLEVQSVEQPSPRKKFQIEPWMVEGAVAGVGIAGVVTEVAAIWWSKKKRSPRRGKPSVSDLAKAIREKEGR